MDVVFRTDESCPKCGRPIVRLAAPRDGWSHYCPYCEYLTLTRPEAAHALATLDDGAAGVVIGVGTRLRIVWDNGRVP